MPNSSDSRSVEQLKQEAERNRAELAQTVNQLRDTVSYAAADLRDQISPETIKANVGEFVRTRGETMMEAARQNPLQAAAVGAMVAYPVMALARRIPPPLLMIGAGFYLMSSDTGRNLSRRTTERAEDLADQGRRMAHDLRDKSADALASVAEQASLVGSSIRSSVNETVGAVGRAADDLRSSVADRTSDSQHSIREAAHGLTSGAQDVGRDVSSRARDAIGSLQNSTSATADSLMRWARENPLMAAAIGMAVGGIVASVIPVTRVEARVAETAAGDLRRRLGDAAAQGMTTATGAVEQIAQRASQQGLTPEAIADAAREFGERALKVAEAAAGAALSRSNGHDDSNIPAGG